MPALLPFIRLLLLVTLALLCGGAGGPDGSLAGPQDEFRYKPAETLTTTEATPVDRVAAIRYLYEDHGRLSDVITLANPEDPACVVTHTRYTYDG